MSAPAVRRQAYLPAARRAAASSTYDATSRTIELVGATETPVRMPGWQLGLDVPYFLEILDLSPGAGDLSQIAAGNCPLLDSHSRWAMADRLGAIADGRIESRQLILTAAFGQSDAARTVEADAAGPNPPPVSVGYRRDEVLFERFEGEVPVYRVTKWTLNEGSFTPIAADPNAGVRSDQGSHPCIIMESRAMKPEKTPAEIAAETAATEAARAAQVATEEATRAAAAETARVAEVARVAEAGRIAEAARAAAPGAADQVVRFAAADAVDFIDQARTFGVEDGARALLAQNTAGAIGVEAARSALLKQAAEKQKTQTAGLPAGGAARSGDTQTAERSAIVEAIVCRALGTKPSDAAREHMGLRLLELAAQRAGLNPRERDATLILRAANTTSDFPLILEAAANKVLLERYQTAAPTYQAIARRRDLRDFKTTKLLRIGDFPTLLPYQEDGEIKSGTINEGRETVTLASFGRILRLSRQAIVNDDLNAFDDVFGSIGNMIALFENATFYAMKAANSGNGPKLADAVNLFNAAHSNLAGSGAAPDITTMGAARAAIRKQKNSDGNVLNLVPKYILTGPDIETSVEQLVASIQPVVLGQVNPFSGKLTPVVEGSITGNAWEVYADPAVAPVFSYGYLADAPGPRVLTEESFNVDGIAFRATLDFYTGATDYRGGYRNPGA